jgi:hypothetical protein
MQVRSPEFGGPERVSFEKTVLITLRYLGHAGNIRLISDLFNVSALHDFPLPRKT